MKRLGIIFIFLFLAENAVSQAKYVTFGVDYTNFSWGWLDNRSNTNSKNSYLNSIGLVKETPGVFSWQLSIQAGKLNNLGKNGFYNQSSNWIKFNADALVNVLRIVSKTQTKIKPWWLIGYGLNYIEAHKETGFKQLGINLNTGVKISYKISNDLLVSVYNGIGQQLGFDYRTFYVLGFSAGFKLNKIDNKNTKHD